jgi:hypothetical protein
VKIYNPTSSSKLLHSTKTKFTISTGRPGVDHPVVLGVVRPPQAG